MRILSFSIGAFGFSAALAFVACDDGGLAGDAAPGPGTGGTQANTESGGTGTSAGGSVGSGGTESTGGTVPAACGTLSGSGWVTERYGFTRVTREGKEYIVQNNVWGNANASQKIQVNDGSSFYKITEQTGDNSSNSAPVSYPSAFIGSNNNRASANSGLPKAVSSLGTVMTSFSHNANGSVPGIYNASYDVWFNTTSQGDTNSPTGGFLMVWLYDPTQKQPVGGVRWSGVTISGVDGTWDVWLGGSPPVISYVRTQNTTSLTFDLNAFIKDAVNNRPGSIQSGWYLTNVFGGFEIWSGGAGLQATCFYVNI